MWGWNENPWDRDRDRWSSSYGGEWSSKGWKGGGKDRPFGQGKGITINIGDLSSIQAQQQAQSLQQHQHAIAQDLAIKHDPACLAAKFSRTPAAGPIIAAEYRSTFASVSNHRVADAAYGTISSDTAADN